MALALGDFLKPHIAEVIPDPSNEKAAKITIEPLDRGFGHTLGNALRRVLLSSMSFWVPKGSGSHMRAELELFGVVSERSWRRLGASWRRFGISWDSLGASWERLGVSWERLRASWERLRGSWERLGAS